MKCDRYNKTVQDDAVWDKLKQAGRSDTRSGRQTYLTPQPVTLGEDASADEVSCLDDVR